jgi:large subunit ribosomal protein L30e
MIDVDKAISSAVKTGKVSLGAISAVQNAQTGKAKLIILAANCPKNVRGDVEYYSKLSKVPLIIYKGTSLDLAAVCGKPFSVSALSIREPGDSEILKLTETTEAEEPSGGNE